MNESNPKTQLHCHYHDTAYGFPLADDNQLFGRFILEINQAGLSWTTILVKQENFFKAYHEFNIKKIATYQEKDKARLLEDAGIIRNRLKIEAIIHNAQVVLTLQKQYGSFINWLEYHHSLNREEWTKLFKKKFKFTGGEIVNEFLVSTSFLPGAHEPQCPIYQKIISSNPAWARGNNAPHRTN